MQIRRSGEQAAALTGQLLAFGRRQMLRPVDLDVNQVVDNIQKMLRRLIGEHIELRVQLADNLKPVQADRSQLEQVLVNLAVNARDAMPSGGRLTIRTEHVTIGSRNGHTVHGPAPGAYSALVVEDTGEGIDPSILRDAGWTVLVAEDPAGALAIGGVRIAADRSAAHRRGPAGYQRKRSRAAPPHAPAWAARPVHVGLCP